MSAIRRALEAERAAEQAFVERALKSERSPKGWPASLVMFHLGMWRERFRDALASINDGKDYERPPANTDEVNDAELSRGIGTPLTDAASRADHLLTEIMELYDRVGERPIEWYISRTTTEAVLRNSFTHPRLHMTAYYDENGLADFANEICEDAVSEMRAVNAPPIVMGAVIYNLACMRARQDRSDESIDLLLEGIPLRPDIREMALADPDLAALREDTRFQELVKT